LAGSPLPPPWSIVASCISSRGHIGLRGGPCEGGGGGAAGFICAGALELSARPPSRAAQEAIRRSSGVVKLFAISGRYEGFRRGGKSYPQMRPHIPASQGSVTSFPGHRCGGNALQGYTLALAGDGDIFVAKSAPAVPAGFGHRSGDFIQIDAAVGRGLGKIPRPAVGQGGMGAAFLTARKALVDAVTVGLVGNDENLGFGRRARCGEQEYTGQKRRKGSHAAPMNERAAPIRINPKG
jgi:hypothetical protein